MLRQTVKVLDRAVEPGGVRPERDANVVGAAGTDRQLGVVDQQPRAGQRETTDAVDAPELQRRDKRRRIEPVNRGGAVGAASGCIKRRDGPDPGLARGYCIREEAMSDSEAGDATDSRDDHPLAHRAGTLP